MKPKFTDGHKYKHGYKQAVDTDIRKTFQRIKDAMKDNAKEVEAKVKPIIRAKVA